MWWLTSVFLTLGLRQEDPKVKATTSSRLLVHGT